MCPYIPIFIVYLLSILPAFVIKPFSISLLLFCDRTSVLCSNYTISNYLCQDKNRGSISRIEDKSRTVTDIELYAISKVLEIPLNIIFEDVKNI